jgi:hypothetical protein
MKYFRIASVSDGIWAQHLRIEVYGVADVSASWT